jgi:beta-glucanase (GH16 family)
MKPAVPNRKPSKNQPLRTLLAAVFTLALTGGACTAVREEPLPAGTLLWADEFNYQGLPDPDKWVYETGMVRNDESQCYTRRAENCRVEDGVLIITARKEDYYMEDIDDVAEYTSASINTRGRCEFHGGRVEVRAKLPQGRGVWPAIWTLGANIGEVGHPRCGEIDIMEFVGYEPDLIYGSVHTYDYTKEKLKSLTGDTVLTHLPDFHVYAIEWSDDKIDFFLDATKYFSCPRDTSHAGNWPFDVPQYLLINLAIGGTWGGLEGIDDSIFPVEYRIDYVRIYSL